MEGAIMMRFEELASGGAIPCGGERWQAIAAQVCIPAPHAAAWMLRSTWCKPDRLGVWPATLNLAPGAARVWELAASQGGTRADQR
jgi:hypothetical protein